MKTKLIAVIAVALLAMAPASEMLASTSSTAKTKTTATAKKSTKTTAATTLTAKGLGSITIGMKRTAIPASLTGLYTSMKYVKNLGDDMDVPNNRAGYVDFKKNGKTVFTATILANGTVGGIEVFDPKIKSSAGIAVGTSAATVKKLPGATYDQDLGVYYAGDISYWVDPDVIKIVVGETYYGY